MQSTTLETKDMLYLENLVKIKLNDETRERYRLEMSKILDYVNEITSLDLGDVKADHTHRNIFKKDKVIISENHTKKALANAPDKVGSLYKVAQVIKQ